jgi:hypothetical protein
MMKAVRGERSVEQCVAKFAIGARSAHGGAGDGSEERTGARPVPWQRKKRHGPAKKAPITTTRRLGEGPEPCLSDW